MTLLDGWKESLHLLQPQTAKLFALATINACLKTVQTLCRQWLFFSGFMITALVLLIVFICLLPVSLAVSLGNYLLRIIFYSGFFLLILACRASIVQKNGRYFLSYWSWLIQWVAAMLVLGIILQKIGVPSLCPTSSCYLVAYPCIMSIWALFFVEGPARPAALLHSFYKMLRMLFYNAPIILLFEGLFWGLKALLVLVTPTLLQLLVNLIGRSTYQHALVQYSVSILAHAYLAIVIASFLILFFIVIMLIPLATYTNFYIKKIHEHFSFYSRTH